MIRKYLLVFFLVALESACFAQDFKIKEDIAYVNDIAYVQVEKSKEKQYRIFNITSLEKLLIINMSKTYSRIIKKEVLYPTVFFVGQKENIIYEHNIQTDIDLVSFLYNQKLIFIDGSVNQKLVHDYLKSREKSYFPSANPN